MLPAGGPGDMPGKFAPSAVPALVAELQKLGAVPSALEAVLVGGAQMFSFGNATARAGSTSAPQRRGLREALEAARIPCSPTRPVAPPAAPCACSVEDPQVIVKEAGCRASASSTGRARVGGRAATMAPTLDEDQIAALFAQAEDGGLPEPGASRTGAHGVACRDRRLLAPEKFTEGARARDPAHARGLLPYGRTRLDGRAALVARPERGRRWAS